MPSRWRRRRKKLPAGIYRLGDVPEFCGGANAALAWLMGGYGFDRYKKKAASKARLVLPQGVDGAEVARIAENLFLAPRPGQHARQ